MQMIYQNSEPLMWGWQKGFTPICSDFPISSDLFRFALLAFRNAPVCSDLLRLLPICFENESKQINPFPPTPFASPRGNNTENCPNILFTQNCPNIPFTRHIIDNRNAQEKRRASTVLQQIYCLLYPRSQPYKEHYVY